MPTAADPIKPPALTAADHIKNYRTRNGLSQDKFASLINVSQGLIHSWESERRLPSPRLAKVIEEKTSGSIKRAEMRPDLWE